MGVQHVWLDVETMVGVFCAGVVTVPCCVVLRGNGDGLNSIKMVMRGGL